jgi:hypothetical protein
MQITDSPLRHSGRCGCGPVQPAKARARIFQSVVQHGTETRSSPITKAFVALRGDDEIEQSRHGAWKGVGRSAIDLRSD